MLFRSVPCFQLLEEVLANKKVGIKVATTLFIKVIERKTKTPIGDSKKTGNHKTMTPLCKLEFIHIMNEPWNIHPPLALSKTGNNNSQTRLQTKTAQSVSNHLVSM